MWRSWKSHQSDDGVDFNNSEALNETIYDYLHGSDMGSTGSKDLSKSRTTSEALVPMSPPYTTEVELSTCNSSSIARKFNPERLNIIKLKVGIDKKLTTIDERSSAVLKYRTPHFRASATIEVPALDDGESIQVGWIQTCVHMQFINTYGSEGVTSWEFPEIVSGRFPVVSDADGKHYPWYGSKHEVQTLKGPLDSTTFTVHMNDNFFPQVTWYIPDSTYDKKPRLTHIYRKQKFYTYLALNDLANEQFYLLKTVTWGMELSIEVNPKSPLGKRAKLLGPYEQKQPVVLDKHIPIPKCALNPPNANSSQTLIWRPSNGSPKVVVPPVETTMNVQSYLEDTRHLGEKLAQMMPES